jgi:mRNA interferase MazF
MKRGEIFLVSWPFSDFTGRKLRPAVVVQADFLNGMIADSVLLQITGKSRQAVTEVVLDPGVETASGLRFLSYAVCNNFLTMDQAKAHRRMGTLSAAAMASIEDCLKTALQLP